jgi:hypothetical protein
MQRPAPASLQQPADHVKAVLRGLRLGYDKADRNLRLMQVRLETLRTDDPLRVEVFAEVIPTDADPTSGFADEVEALAELVTGMDESTANLIQVVCHPYFFLSLRKYSFPRS